MSTYDAKQQEWAFSAGTQPSTDATALSTNHWTEGRNIRYVRGNPEKLGGWQKAIFEEGQEIDGVARSIFGGLISGKARTVIGTHTNLYSLIASSLEDITPEGLAAGNADEIYGEGYGMGLYGVGLYGVSKVSTEARRFPRIWCLDRFGDSIIGTPGNGEGIYEWGGDSTEPATLIPNAPTQVNYAFVFKNIIITFGEGGVENRIKTSDIGDKEQWTATPQNQVFEDELEDIERLISHVVIQGEALIFTENATLLMEYIGQPLIWRFTMIDPGIGIIGPLARCAAQGSAYWMGRDNFYMWSGGNVEVIPSNTHLISTGYKYVFDDINQAQKSKCFTWFNERFSEVWFHYPSADSNECNRVARVNTKDFTWSFDDMDRTAAEWPYALYGNPRLITSDGILYRHELTNDDAGEAMSWLLKSPARFTGANMATLTGIIPDSIQTGTDVLDNWGVLDTVYSLESDDIGTPITLQVQAWEFPQSRTLCYDKTFTITKNTDRVSLQAKGRVFQYTLRGQAIEQRFVLGKWIEEWQEAGRK